jgi:shikimate kinase
MTYDELAQEMYKRADSLDHLTAKAEMARRAAVQGRWKSCMMLASVIVATIAATASAFSAYYTYLSVIARLPK